jgi:photosystem II stability/assembly factor-like uncharacterized protein
MVRSRIAVALLALTEAASTRFSSGGVNLWTPSDTGAGRVTSIAAEACRPTTLYAMALDGPGPGGLYRSTDGGNTWNGLPEPGGGPCNNFSGGNVALAGCPATALVATCDGHVYRTSDGSDSLTRSDEGLPVPDFTSVAIDSTNASLALAGLKTYGIYRSVNGGLSWSRVSLFQGVTQTIADPSRSGTFYELGTERGLFHFGDFPFCDRTTDSGQTWSYLESISYCLSIAPLDSSVLYTCYGARSLDAGATWHHFVIPGATYIFTLAVSPVDSEIVLAATDVGLRRSNDGGTSWGEFNSGLESETVTVLAFDPGGARIYAGTETGRIYQIDVQPGVSPIAPARPAPTSGR